MKIQIPTEPKQKSKIKHPAKYKKYFEEWDLKGNVIFTYKNNKTKK